jgi:hypothetical protein
LPSKRFFTTSFSAYGFVHNNSVYLADAVDYSSNGKVAIYDTNGVLKNNALLE